MIQGFLCKEEAQGFWNGEKNVREIIIFVRGKSMYRLIMATKAKHITITGSLGSGKSVVSSLLHEELGYPVVSVGGILRKMAQEYNMDTTQFNIYMEQHPELDYELDNRVTAMGKEELPYIFDSRLAWYFVPSSFKVALIVDDSIAAQRIFQDSARLNETYNNDEEARERIQQRRKSELLRYKQLYKVDLEATENYDLVIDTGGYTPKEVASKILSAYKEACEKES